LSQNPEELFREIAKPPGKTEEDRCNNAISAIKNAIQKSEKLSNHKIHVFIQGSYRNNTNVRKDSDIDIGILCQDVFFYAPLPEGLTKERLNFQDATYFYTQYKNELEEALVDYFGHSAVIRGNKAFDIHETSYHVEADVVALFEHRRYSEDMTFIEGVELRTDNGNQKVINWPEQNYQNGVDKNNSTGRRFKSIVRILKAITNEMFEKNLIVTNIPGYLIECLVWNVPNDRFQHTTITDDLINTLKFLFENTKTDELSFEWGEINELKYLFRDSQKWTRIQTNLFIEKVMKYMGL